MTRSERIKTATDAYNAALAARWQAFREHGEESTIYLDAVERLRDTARALGAALVNHWDPS